MSYKKIGSLVLGGMLCLGGAAYADEAPKVNDEIKDIVQNVKETGVADINYDSYCKKVKIGNLEYDIMYFDNHPDFKNGPDGKIGPEDGISLVIRPGTGGKCISQFNDIGLDGFLNPRPKNGPEFEYATNLKDVKTEFGHEWNDEEKQKVHDLYMKHLRAFRGNLPRTTNK